MRELRAEIPGNDAGAGAADYKHARFSQRGCLITGNAVTDQACFFPGIYFAAKFLFLVDGGLVEDSSGGDGVLDDFVGEGELQFQRADQFIHSAANLFLVGTGEIHRGRMDDGEDAAVEGCRDAVAVGGTAVDADN